MDIRAWLRFREARSAKKEAEFTVLQDEGDESTYIVIPVFPPDTPTPQAQEDGQMV